jgi:hypothetical protein
MVAATGSGSSGNHFPKMKELSASPARARYEFDRVAPERKGFRRRSTCLFPQWQTGGNAGSAVGFLAAPIEVSFSWGTLELAHPGASR